MLGHNAKQFQPEASKSTAGKIGCLLHFFSPNLVHHHADNLHPFTVEEGFVESSFIYRQSDSTWHNKQNFTSKNSRHSGVREIEYRPHAGMTTAFDDGKVLFPTGPIK